MGSLIESILRENSKAADSDLALINKYCDLYNLKWIPSSHTNNGAYFIMSEVCIAIGSNSGNFRKHWSKSAIDAENKRRKNSNKSYLKGKHFKLEGERLNNFLNSYQNKYRVSLNNRVLWIGDWLTCLDFIIRKKNNVIQTEEILNTQAKSSKSKVESKSPDDKVQVNKSNSINNNISEAVIHSDLVKLLSYSNFHFKQEDPISNTLMSKDGCTSRRLDLTVFKQGVVYVYEIKKYMINCNHITTTLGDKGYYQLAKKRYNASDVNLRFISPNGISQEAARLLDCMDNIEFISVSEFVKQVLQTIKSDYDINCKEGLWYFESHIANQFNHLIHNESINTEKNIYSL